MAESFKKIENQVCDQIKDLTLSALKELKTMWLETFEVDVCELYFQKLPEHVSTFLCDIVQETRTRQKQINERMKQLTEEAETLMRLLKIKIDMNIYKKLPLHTAQIRLDQSLSSLRQTLAKRHEDIMELLLEQEVLCEELGEQPRPLLADPLPSVDELQDFRIHLDALQAEKKIRMNIVATYRREIKHCLEELELPPEQFQGAEQHLLNERSIHLTQVNVDALKDIHDRYTFKMTEVKSSIADMKIKLKSLWDCLEVNEKIRRKYSKIKDNSQKSHDMLALELEKCENAKKRNLKQIITRIRNEICLWWDKTLKSDVERSRFSIFTLDEYTEETLTLHELELENLRSYFESNEKIFAFIDERNTLWHRMIAIEAKTSEPDRYRNRGGQLLKEERERKIIAKKLPKIEEILKTLLSQYEVAHNRKFTVYGVDVAERINRDWDERRLQKEKLINARKNSAMNDYGRPFYVRQPLTTKTVPIASSTTLLRSPETSRRKFSLPNKIITQTTAKRSLFSLLSPSTRSNVQPPGESGPKSPILSVLDGEQIMTIKMLNTKSYTKLCEDSSANQQTERITSAIAYNDCNNIQNPTHNSDLYHNSLFQENAEITPALR